MRLLLLVLAVLTAGCSAAESSNYGSGSVTIINQDSERVSFRVEVPKTSDGFMKGLMFRESLPAGSGMLFIYPDSALRSFWMKNMLIPLDIIFIDENLTVRKVVHAVPCVKEPCEIYSSGSEAKYVLEINENLAERRSIKEGGRVVIDVRD